MQYVDDILGTLGLILLIVLFGGDPDIADGIIHSLMSCGDK